MELARYVVEAVVLEGLASRGVVEIRGGLPRWKSP